MIALTHPQLPAPHHSSLTPLPHCSTHLTFTLTTSFSFPSSFLSHFTTHFTFAPPSPPPTLSSISPRLLVLSHFTTSSHLICIPPLSPLVFLSSLIASWPRWDITHTHKRETHIFIIYFFSFTILALVN